MRLLPHFHKHVWAYVKDSLRVERDRTSYTEVCTKCPKQTRHIVKHI